MSDKNLEYHLEGGKTLKAKHRNSSRPHIGDFALLHRDKIDPPEGTLIYKAGNQPSKHGGNSGKGTLTKTLKPRQKAWGPW